VPVRTAPAHYPALQSIMSWDDLEEIWHHTFYLGLYAALVEHPVSETEAPLIPEATRERVAPITLDDVLWWLPPDGKTQVTTESMQDRGGSCGPQKIHTVVITTQHAGPPKATRRYEAAGYTGADEVASSTAKMKKLIEAEAMMNTRQCIKRENGLPAITLYDDHAERAVPSPLVPPCSSK
jgi:hypothetical protein